MISIQLALVLFSVFLSLCAFCMSAVAVIKTLASEKSTHTLYQSQTQLEEPEMTPIPKEVEEMLANPFNEDEFDGEMPTKDLQKMLLGDI